MQVDSLLIFDQVKRKIWVVAYGDLMTAGADSSRGLSSGLRSHSSAGAKAHRNPCKAWPLWSVGNRPRGALTRP
jgi:hypothetical protein